MYMKSANHRISFCGTTLLVAAAAMALPSFASAQSSEAGAASENALEEIIVTARKREESLQEVGLSVSALSKTDLDQRFDIDLQTLQNSSPNLIIDDIQQGPGSPAAISIRGIGTTDVEKNFDPTVGVVLDGVFIGVNSGAMLKAIDLQSVEVLRGPQGTLFGRNSIGGVINVTRGKPDFDGFSGSVRAGVGNYQDLQLDAFINVTASDQFAFRLGAAHRENDGWFHNLTLGRDVGEMDYTIISPSFTWRPTENFEVYYRYDNSKQDQDANTLHNVATPGQVWCFYYNQCAPSLGKPQSGSDYDVLQNDDPPYQSYFDTETHIVNATLTINDRYNLVYVFGDFSTDEKVYQDWDATALTLYHTDRPAKWNQQSHELRLNYSGDRLSYTAGLYYWDSDYSIDLLSYIGFVDFLYGFPPGTVFEVAQSVAQTTKSYAAFFEGDYQLTDQWTLTVGGRYTKDKKTSAVQDVIMPELEELGGPGNPFRKNWDEFTPKVGLRFQVNDDLMLYALYSKGFRAGGFSGRPGTYEAAGTPYNPETVDNYELGMKSELMDNRLRLNVSVFQMDYKDKQEEQSVPTSQGTGQQTLVLNASKATIKGMEVDLNWLLTDMFSIEGNLGLLDAKYDELIDPVTQKDLSYLKLRRAPDVTATITPVLTFKMPGGELAARASWHYIDDVELTFLNSPQSHVSSHSTLDASLIYTFNENFSVGVYGLNLNKDNSWTQAYDVGTSVDFAGLWTYTAIRPPRTYGLVASYNF
jgi:iron complex outermembrane receptor protein